MTARARALAEPGDCCDASARLVATVHALAVRSSIAAFVAAAALGLLAAPNCGGSSGNTPPATKDGGVATKDPPQVPARAEFDVVAFGRVLGTIAPCGCTTEPLGGLQYAFGWLAAQGPDDAHLVVEPGSFLYPDPKGPYAPGDAAGWEQAESRATLLHERFAALGAQLVSGVGPFDLVAPAGVKALATHALPRTVANLPLPADSPIARHRLVTLQSQGVRWSVGVTQVIDPATAGLDALGKPEPPVPALQRELAAMQAAGAKFTVVLAHGPRTFAESLAKEVPGLGLIVVGTAEGVERQRVGTPATKMNGAWILEPGEMLQTVSRVRLSIDASGGAVPEPSTWTMAAGRADLERELSRVNARLAKFKADPSADASFVERLERERERLEREIAAPPEGAAVVTFEQVKVTCRLPVDQGAKQALGDYDKRVAASNLARFTGVKPPAPAKGQSGYAGIERCNECHEEAVAFWRTTVHSHAWQTLVDDDKQLDLSCVSCHVTGFRKPGGSELVENAGLRDVQCEVCHGAGALHADDGGSKAGLVTLSTTSQLCTGECHTPEHSDTFDYVPYLRDVLGKGHGEAARAKLGEGPTGAELRKAGLEKAGGACKKAM